MSTGEPTQPTPAADPSTPPVTGPAQSPTAFPTSSGPGVAPPPTPPASPPPTNVPGSAPSHHEWPAQAADLVVDVVDRVSSATTGPILTVAKGIVYGLAALILGGALLVLTLIAVIRVLDVAIPGDVWIVYTGLGAVLTLFGLFAWSKRRAPAT